MNVIICKMYFIRLNSFLQTIFDLILFSKKKHCMIDPSVNCCFSLLLWLRVTLQDDYLSIGSFGTAYENHNLHARQPRQRSSTNGHQVLSTITFARADTLHLIASQSLQKLHRPRASVTSRQYDLSGDTQSTEHAVGRTAPSAHPRAHGSVICDV